jgi:molybdate transport system substrate-binding protein
MKASLAFLMLANLNMIAAVQAETIHLYAAGDSNRIEAKYGPSGLLKNEIVAGAKVDVFASANMEHPQALSNQHKSGPVVRFARNKLCALVKPGAKGGQHQFA